MSEETSYNDDAVLKSVLQRSATDREFRTRLIAQPEIAIEQLTGVSISSLQTPIRLKFVEKDPDLDAFIVLPDFEEAEGELSDADLEAVAGGTAWCITSCWMSVGCVISEVRAPAPDPGPGSGGGGGGGF